MNYKIIFVFFLFSVLSCTEKEKINYSKNFKNYTNKGFALVYDDDLFKKKLINKKLDDRSLLIFNDSLQNDTAVRVTNLINGKYLVAKVGANANYPFFYNSVISKRIASDLNVDINQPYIEIKTINNSNSFIIGKAKTFDEEKEVADKVPVKGIEIINISVENDKNKIIKDKSKKNKSFNYIIKIADFYFEASANILKERLLAEHNITDVKVKKVSKNSYRVYKGPFYNLDSIKSEYSNIIKLNFENIEIIRL